MRFYTFVAAIFVAAVATTGVLADCVRAFVLLPRLRQ